MTMIHKDGECHSECSDSNKECYEGPLPEALRGEFKLRAFPGRLFVVNTEKSYGDQVVVDIVHGKIHTSFSRGTIGEIIARVVPKG